MGAATIAQVNFFNTHPTGRRPETRAAGGFDGRRRHPGVRIRAELRGDLSERIPLTRSISEVGGDVMKQAVGDLFRK